MKDSSPRILITGDYEAEEFTRVLKSTACSFEFVELQRLTDSPEAHAADLLVLCQSNRNTLSKTDSDFLIEKFPQSAKLLLLGSYCEGELRSGSNSLKDWYRRYWYQWREFAASFAADWRVDRQHLAQLPTTATDSDRLAIVSDEPRVARSSDLIVGANCRWNSDWELIKDFCDTQGIPVSRDLESESIGVSVIVEDSLDETLERSIEKEVALRPDRKVVLLLNFPRLNDWERANRIGVFRIISKPFLNRDLALALSDAMSEMANS